MVPTESTQLHECLFNFKSSNIAESSVLKSVSDWPSNLLFFRQPTAPLSVLKAQQEISVEEARKLPILSDLSLSRHPYQHTLFQ